MTHAPSQAEKAEAFRALHHGERPLILPNAWDVPSARVFEEAGFPALATSSAALAASLGHRDGERIPRTELFAAVRRIANAVSVPVSVDLEAGFGANEGQLAETIRAVVVAGGVGINLEDSLPPEGDRLRSLEEQLVRLRTVRATGRDLGVPLVINARTDAYVVGSRPPAERLAEAIRRSLAFESAGADSLYPMGLVDSASIASYVRAVHLPVNVMVRKGLPPVVDLERLGVKRLSLGPSAMYATLGLLRRAAEELRAHGTYEALTRGAITFDELMSLAEARSHSRSGPGGN